ncbi:hypothetical protein CWB99_07700 [Pseudoalteromonas rubra]|uniref:Carrier domain-containing protein n=1 Tax=Pseudoalteromonas rubra TaxID=43658 RepID=A0A5S3WQZ8_9GAMM|nr:non-ribosomal peptide synthetase [Pseudoalteromonas rubra]TMP29964.1 hypothetical protein CWB99_07700 [Pseudoalteromonas rubra]TMP32192.1 hypothetical protein CWC00_13425 [Pseudoalteromonas rubra]
MEANSILKEAQSKGIYLYLEQGKLKFKAKTTHFPDALKKTIKEHRAALIELLERMDEGAGNPHHDIALLDRTGVTQFPLSSPQNRLWTLAQLSDLGASYNMSFALSWDQALTLSHFNASILALINRHEAIRTTIAVDEQGNPYQVINEHHQYECEFVDLSELEADAQQQRIDALLEQEMCFEFNLEQDLMLRVVVVRKHQQAHIIVLTMHHIASDGWSMDIVRQELLALYNAAMTGRPVTLPELPRQYVDYASWQAHYVKSESIAKQVAYWREHLNNLPAVHSLALDHPRPTEKQYAGAQVERVLGAEIAGRLKALAGQLETTPFVLLHAALSLVLARHSNTSDIVVGTPISGREQSSLQSLVGFFVNNLVLRVNTEHVALDAYIEHVKSVHADAHKNQAVPFEQLVEELDVPRTAAHMPVFQIMLHGQSGLSSQQDEASSAHVAILPSPQVYCKCDMEINLHLEDDSVLLNFTYDTSLFEQASIERYCTHVANVLTEMASIEDINCAKVTDITMLSPQEQAYLLREFNDSAQDIPDNVCIQHYFEQQVARVPDNPAVSYSGHSITYRELYERANQLANYLVTHGGVSAHTRVGVFIERSVDMVVSLVAILQAGGTYVPLDPSNPTDRIRYMIADSQVALVVTSEACLESLAAPDDMLTYVVLDDAQTKQQIAKSARSAPDIEVAADSLAYINYTSGSTGNPKGVMIEHAALVNAIVDNFTQFGVTSQSHFYHSTAFGFDVASGVVWMCLCTGAQMTVSASLDMQHELEQLGSVTHLMMTPSILAEIDPEPLGTIEVVISGGEACEPRTRQRWQHLPRFFNAYGPTEATIWCAIEQVAVEQAPIPIGKPMYNTSLLVLNAQQQLTPQGAIGELYIGGRGLARGYFNRPELTEERFVPNPYYDPQWPSSSERIYRTGDLVRMTEQGHIEFVGRTDSQIKMMGYRIELSEIAFHLEALPEVELAAVVVQGEGHEKRLVGFVELAPGIETSEPETLQHIRAQLAKKVPGYMVPNVLMVLTEWPLTVNGKIDQLQLVKTEVAAAEAERVVPVSELEKQLVALWSTLLGIPADDIGTTTNFFAIGGNSLLAIRLNSMLKKESGLGIKLADFFERPTIKNLAERCVTELSVSQLSANTNQIVPLERNLKLYPLSHAQQRLWFLDKLQGGSAEYNIFSAFKITGQFDVAIAERAFLEIIDSHEILRTVYLGEEETWQSVQATSDIHFTIGLIDLTRVMPAQQSAHIDRLLINEAQHVFALATDLMIRVHYIQLSPAEGVLVVNMHHIAADGWSIELVKHEFAQRYIALTEGVPRTLSKPEVQYIDYAHWQSAYLSQPEADQQLRYWQHQLSDAPTIHGLPLDYVRPAEQRYAGAKVEHRLPAQVSTALTGLAEHFNITPFMLLHAALSLVLARHSNRTDIVIGTPVANRQHPQLAALIGCFVNTIALRVNTDFAQLDDYIQHVKQVHVEALENQDIPFEKLVDELNIERSTAFSPLFQVLLLTHTEFGVQAQTLDNDPSLRIEPWQTENGFCKFDIEAGLYISNDGVHIEFNYATSLFTQARIELLVQHLANVLTALSECQPSSTLLQQLPMLSQSEAAQQLTELHTPANTQNNTSLHQMFSKAATRFAGDIAVRHGAQTITYEVLEKRAQQLAHVLQTQFDVQPGSLVGLCLNRSIDTIVAMLAVLKAGGAYVPLDAHAPQQRLLHQIADTAMATVICHQEFVDRFAQFDGTVFDIDQGAFSVAPSLLLTSVSDTALKDAVHVAVDQLAYVIYTSGSTGMPKGICQTHRTIVNLVDATLCSHSRHNTLQFAPYTFDVSVQEIFSALLTGSELHLIDQTLKEDLLALAHDAIWQHVERAFLPPKVFDILTQEWADSAPDIALKDVFLAGEACELTSAIRTWIEQDPARKVFNHYGPTETHVVTAFEVNHTNIQSLGQFAPLGQMIPGHTAVVLQPDLTLTPSGGIGELWVSGAGLAARYLNQADMTRHAFQALTFSGKASRFYRTGDLVRHDSVDGLHYVGRLDNQVQLRGFRIELAEIEYCLSTDMSVDSCLVRVCQVGGADHLVAYIKPSQAAWIRKEALLAELKRGLETQLASYMVPQYLVLVEDWPLTTNGKIDTARLDTPEADMSQQCYQPPENDTERVLVDIWADLLALPGEQISTRSKFFELGGHSLSVVKLASLIRQQFDKTLPLADIFNQPTIAAIAANLDSQTPQESALKLEAYSGLDEIAPASYSQQRMWFIDKLQGQSTEYNLPSLFKVSGQLDIDIVKKTGAQILQRQQVLLSRFIERDGIIYQVKSAADELPVEVHDLLHIEAGTQELKVAEIISEAMTYSFDLENDLPIRVTLITLSSDSAVLLFNMHHIVSDGWSLEVLANEFCSLYQANVTGETLHLPALPIQYRDYAQWQRNYLQSEAVDEQLAYWQAQLYDLPVVHSLPLDNTRPPIKQHMAGVVNGHLDESSTQQLRALARAHDLTPFMLMHGLLAVLISRHSGTHDIVIGTPVANRTQLALESLVGLFVNTLVLRLNTGSQAVASYFSHIRDVHSSAQSNQDIPFDFLVEQLQAARDTSHSPLFQILMTSSNDYGMLDTEQHHALSLPGATLTPADLGAAFSKFDLEVNFDFSGEEVGITWVYDDALFSNESIEQLNTHFCQLAESLSKVRDPQQTSLTSLTMLDSQAQQALLYGLNETAVEYASQTCIHQLFEQHAEMQPNQIAVTYECRSLTYGELNSQANQLARYIRTQATLTPDAIVGLYAERSIEMVVALLAILKAGAAYLPLDPSLPDGRLAHMLEDAGVELVLSHAQHPLPVPFTGQEIILAQCLNDSSSDLVQLSPLNLSVRELGLHARNLAYVIYTSGSTGLPKGVMVEHQALFNRVHWMHNQYGMTSSDSVLQKTPFGFDVSVWEFLWTLGYGGQLVMARPEGHKDPQYLSEIIQTAGITKLHFVPSMLGVILEHGSLSHCHSIKQIFCSGEALALNHVTELYAQRPEVELHNLYGPTEAAIDVSYWDCAGDNQSTVPIGRPIDNTQLIILDDSQQLTPHGSVGELYIGGDCLARGYLNRAELTAERFVKNPYYEAGRQNSSPRLYRTGDLARLRHDGAIEYLGRTDHQVKIRGLRVELGEIEYHLGQLPEVESALVVAKEKASAVQLIAYVRLNADEPGNALTVAEVRTALARLVPPHMLPHQLVTVGEWPKTPNGKVDKKALPEPEMVTAQRVVTSPSTEQQRLLCEIWSGLLEIDQAQLCIHANFFELGGHSILGIRMLNEVNARFAVSLSVQELFKYQTISELVSLIEDVTMVSQGVDEQLSTDDYEDFSL